MTPTYEITYQTLSGNLATYEVRATNTVAAVRIFDEEVEYKWIKNIKDVTPEPDELDEYMKENY